MSGGTGRSKCRVEGCQKLVIAKVMLTPPVENQKVPFIGLCDAHVSDWIWYLNAGIRMGSPPPFALKPHAFRAIKAAPAGTLIEEGEFFERLGEAKETTNGE